MSNKEKRAKRAKTKAKNNRLQKDINRKEEANERREYLSGLETPQFIDKKAIKSTVDDETYSTSFFSKDLEKAKSARFSSMNLQYNTLYGTVDEFQIDALGEDAEVYTIDEEGVYKAFNRLNELVSNGKLAKSDFQTVKERYRDYLAVWCLSVTEEQPKEIIPYFDWWIKNNNYICFDNFGKELSINKQTSLFDELKSIFEVATHISENNQLLALVDEFIGYTYDHDTEFPWQDNATNVIEYLTAYKNLKETQLKKH